MVSAFEGIPQLTRVLEILIRVIPTLLENEVALDHLALFMKQKFSAI